MKKFLIACAAALVLLTVGSGAQTRPASVLPTPSGLLGRFNQLVLADVQSAEAIAKAAGDTLADQCYLALIGLIQQMQTVSSAQTAKLPAVPLFTDFQKARLLLNAQRSTSPVFTACAPFKAQIKQDALQAPGALLSLF